MELSAVVTKFISHYYQGVSILSEGHVDCDEQTAASLAAIMLPKLLQSQGEFIFTHEIAINLNPVRMLVGEYFDEIKDFIELSEGLMKFYEKEADGKNIAEGEVYITEVQNLIFNNESCRAIGIYKVDGKKSFIETVQQGKDFHLQLRRGIGAKDFNKGCLVIASQATGEMVLKVFQNHPEIKYWKNDFLGIKPLENEFYHTKNVMDLCRDFAMKGAEDMPKMDQVDLLNRTVDFFQTNEQFQQDQFEEEVLQTPDVKEAFIDYRNEFAEKKEIENFEEQFPISKPAFKAAKKYIRSVIKLDRNFHVYVHGQRQHIERGYDEVKGKHFYKLYFDEES